MEAESSRIMKAEKAKKMGDTSMMNRYIQNAFAEI